MESLLLMFPCVSILGCYFHWAQVVWKRVQELGLQAVYNTDDKTHEYIHKLLSVPYLPAEHISTIFTVLQEKAVTEALKELSTYINSTWINSSVWPITSWSVFGCYTRTNSDVEGWHLRMNNNSKRGQLSFYMLLHLPP